MFQWIKYPQLWWNFARNRSRLWCSTQRHRILSFIVRPACWFLAVAIALFPAVHVSGGAYFPLLLKADIEGMGELAKKAGFFRDFFFITIVIAILALTNMCDSILRTRGEVGFFSKACFIILGIFFLMILVFGTSHFWYLAALKAPLDATAKDFSHDYNIIQTTMVAGLLTELIIALREPLAQSSVGSQPQEQQP